MGLSGAALRSPDGELARQLLEADNEAELARQRIMCIAYAEKAGLAPVDGSRLAPVELAGAAESWLAAQGLEFRSAA